MRSKEENAYPEINYIQILKVGLTSTSTIFFRILGGIEAYDSA